MGLPGQFTRPISQTRVAVLISHEYYVNPQYVKSNCQSFRASRFERTTESQFCAEGQGRAHGRSGHTFNEKFGVKIKTPLALIARTSGVCNCVGTSALNHACELAARPLPYTKLDLEKYRHIVHAAKRYALHDAFVAKVRLESAMNF